MLRAPEAEAYHEHVDPSEPSIFQAGSAAAQSAGAAPSYLEYCGEYVRPQESGATEPNSDSADLRALDALGCVAEDRAGSLGRWDQKRPTPAFRELAALMERHAPLYGYDQRDVPDGWEYELARCEGWHAAACENRGDGNRHDGRAWPHQCGLGKHCPFCSAWETRQRGRGRTWWETLEGLAEGWPLLEVAAFELTTPPELHGRVAFQGASTLRKAAGQLLEELWHRKGWTGDPVGYRLDVHLTKSTQPHKMGEHVHGMLPGLGYHPAPGMDPVLRDLALWDSRAKYHQLTPNTGTPRSKRDPLVPGDLYLDQDTDLPWVRTRWAELGCQHFELPDPLLWSLVGGPAWTQAPNDGRAWEGWDWHWQYASMHTDAGQVRHWAYYQTRAYLEDVNKVLDHVDEHRVYYWSNEGGRKHLAQEPTGTFTKGVLARMLDQPRGWRQGATYGRLSNSCKRDTLNDAGALEPEDHHDTCTCRHCGAAIEDLGTMTADDAAWVLAECAPLLDTKPTGKPPPDGPGPPQEVAARG